MVVAEDRLWNLAYRGSWAKFLEDPPCAWVDGSSADDETFALAKSVDQELDNRRVDEAVDDREARAPPEPAERWLRLVIVMELCRSRLG
jgi:hypothetical protein